MFEMRPPQWNAPRPSDLSASVTSVRAVVRDGWYNAFTDLIWWKGYYWLSHARGLGHHLELTPALTSGNSFSVILRSRDLQRWHEAQVFEAPQGIANGSGVGPCHFCTSGDRLYGFFPEETDADVRLRMFVSWTEDGINWTEPELTRMGGLNPYTWRVRFHESRFYSSISYKREGGPLDLIVSDDAVEWSRHAEIASSEKHDYSEESDLYFRADGELWCVVRSEGPGLMFWTRPSYTDWQAGHEMGRCDAPVMCEVDGEVFLAGRIAGPRFAGIDGRTYPQGTTGLYHLTRTAARPLIAMPVGGDSSYAGLVSPGPGKLVMSYYSDVAYWTGILAPRSAAQYQYKASDCDIYIAEIEVAEQVAAT